MTGCTLPPPSQCSPTNPASSGPLPPQQISSWPLNTSRNRTILSHMTKQIRPCRCRPPELGGVQRNESSPRTRTADPGMLPRLIAMCEEYGEEILVCVFWFPDMRVLCRIHQRSRPLGIACDNSGHSQRICCRSWPSKPEVWAPILVCQLAKQWSNLLLAKCLPGEQQC